MLNFDYSGKYILITGASSGIGAATAKMFLEAGAHVAVLARRRDKLQEIADQHGDRVYIVGFDLLNTQDIPDMYSQVERDFGKIDSVILNAGATKDGLMIRMKQDAFDDIIKLNLTSQFTLAQTAIKSMLKNKRYSSSITMISSIVASIGNIGQANYCSAKAGLEGLMRAMAREVAARKIRINCVAPGFIQTDMTAVLSESIQNTILSEIPMKSIGDVKDIANMLCYLSSDAAKYITGQVLHINGGLHLG